VKAEKKLASQEATLVPLCRTGIPLLENPDQHLPKNRIVQPGDEFEDTAFNPGFEIVKF
jgi:hypothetical protein